MISYLQTPLGAVAYQLEQSYRKTMVIRIEENGQVRVLAPLFYDQRTVECFLFKKADWILRKSSQLKDRHRRASQKRFVNGQSFFFLGQKYPLRILKDGVKIPSVDFDGRCWLMKIPKESKDTQNSERLKEKFVCWYKAQAKELLAGRVFHYARLMDVEPLEIKVKNQKRLWGSCHYHQKTLCFNWQIIMAPLSVIDYVIVHELCHLKAPNHSPRFWKLVSDVIPDYKMKHRWLKENAGRMALPNVE